MIFKGRMLPVLLLVWSGLACRAETPVAVRRFPIRELGIQRADGTSLTLRAEIAATDRDRAQGLMHRTEVPAGEGMLFVFDRDQTLSFWMKNTLVALSIAFIAADGRILEIHALQPGSLTPVQSGRSARYALEVPRGWFELVGVGVGDRIRVPTDVGR